MKLKPGPYLGNVTDAHVESLSMSRLRNGFIQPGSWSPYKARRFQLIINGNAVTQPLPSVYKAPASAAQPVVMTHSLKRRGFLIDLQD